MRRWLLRSLGVIGALLVIQSIIWEYARMFPTYRFLVDPWSIRGFDTVHGSINVAIGLALLGAVALTTWSRATERIPRIGIVVYMTLAATIIALVWGEEPKTDADGNTVLDPAGEIVTKTADVDIPLNFAIAIILALVATAFIFIIVRDGVKPRVPILDRRGAMFLVRVGAFVISFFVLLSLFGDSTLTLDAWVAVFLVMAVIGGLSMAARPFELAANRMLMGASVVAGAAIGLSAGAIRSTLLRLQGEIGIPAEYKDTQVTWGYFLANIGVVLVFVGAVALWARRRDTILNQQRARRQREAAEESAREIREAMERAAGSSA